MGGPNTLTQEDFERVACAVESYLERYCSPKVGRLVRDMIRTLGQVTVPIADQRDSFDALRDEHRRLLLLLSELATAHQEYLAASLPAGQTSVGAAHSERAYLFVYGTLKRGFSRNRFLANQRFVAPVQTVPRYRLYDCGSYPALVEDHQGVAIQGELWEVDAKCIAQLDDIEGVPEGLYRRNRIQLSPPYEHYSVQAYFYCKSVDGLPECGDSWQRGKHSR